ncbi:MAG: hypothetical protein A2V70_04715, partial [Planctomycetes bacterium RBG_13_63_9]
MVSRNVEHFCLIPRFLSMAVLRYGTDSSLDLELSDGKLPVECGTPRGRPPDDLAAAVSDALRNPLDYPPLARSTTPGDRVVLALDQGIPQATQITAAVILALVDARVDPDGITVLRTPADADADVDGAVDADVDGAVDVDIDGDVDAAADDPLRLVPGPIRRRITLVTHDPTDRRGLAYLAANDSGDRILLSRALHDADLVLPIGCLHAETAAGYYGIHGAVFPAFSDRKTQQRFRSLGSLDADSSHRVGLLREVDQVAWLLGVHFTIQLVPAAGGSVLHVLAGQSEAVRRRSRDLYERAWSWPPPPRASLVVAAIEGGSDQQTWHNFGRALDTATRLVEDDGSIAVCCDLAAAPGPAMQRLVGAHSRQAALRQIRKERPPDAFPAAQLARALDPGKVYLLSRLAPSLVEDLDMIDVAAPEELARLARHHDSCTLLANAPHTVIADSQNHARTAEP